MTATKTSTREMYVKTRRSWKDGSRIEIDFTSEVSMDGKIEHISNYSVTLWISGEQHHTCTCMGYSRWKKNCCHIKLFLEVEEIRATITDEPVVVAALPVPSIETVVEQINAKVGKVVISICPPVVKETISERDVALAAARVASAAELARIEAETFAQIEADMAATPGVGKSEQARLVDLPLSADEKKYSRWSREERVNSAPLNGNRAFSILKSA